MTSLFSRLQKLNKKGTKAPWKWDAEGTVRGGDRNAVFFPHPRTGNSPFDIVNRDEDAALIVECRNSLPAVLNLIEAAQKAEKALAGFTTLEADDWDAWKDLRRAVAVFVTPEGDRFTMSGQEEQP